ncbi:ABC transporter ATP-binding protein [Streptomyces maremycinicus]|uniref:ABC transporter ATP-binding protein n=1 Tax=Streptomyces maremycinicus TaxID=1679753 RepID=UPI0007C7D6F7|nr:ABC transporter ATP-binding protein [Streptomyces sp. NBRC 110468]
MSSSRVLEVTDLAVDYRVGRRTVRAVSDVALTIDHGKTLGLVGESGSGKTTIGRAILGLAPTAAGRIVFNGQDLAGASPRQRHRTAGRIRAVFQDPYSSLNPALPIAASLLEALPDQRRLPRADARQHLDGLLEKVGLDPAIAARYPGRLSGGQRQRVAIARALISSPELIICDEAVSALDVSIQAQILNLLRDVQRDTGVSYLFIGHDLDVIRYMSDHVAVLYRGQLLETGPVDVVTRRPRHPYTQTLVAATPTLHPETIATQRVGTTDAQQTGGEGCSYAAQCPLAIDTCHTQHPTPQQAADGGHVACHRYPDAA